MITLRNCSSQLGTVVLAKAWILPSWRKWAKSRWFCGMAIASSIFIEGQVVGLEYGSGAVEHGVQDACRFVELIGDFVPVGFLEKLVS